ncbi:MAG: prepilin peptidase, partial [candidate division WOR-3 bacterium]
IYRIPRGKSIVVPGSFCPRCKSRIRWYDNIPILSWLLLRGRCRDCHAPITLRYPLVEALSLLLFVIAGLRFGAGWECLRAILMGCFLIPISFIDIEHRVIPDKLSLPGIGVGLASALLVPGGLGRALLGMALGSSVILVSIGLSWLLARLGWTLFRQKQGMGGGDLRLLALIGSFLDWRLTLLAFFAGAALCVLFGLVAIALGRRRWGRHVPLGPFLSAGGLVALYFGPTLLELYQRSLAP